MRIHLILFLLLFSQIICLSVYAQEKKDASREKKAVEIFLDDEKLDVEADIPSVDLVMSFKGAGYEDEVAKKDFLLEIGEAVKRKPF